MPNFSLRFSIYSVVWCNIGFFGFLFFRSSGFGLMDQLVLKSSQCRSFIQVPPQHTQEELGRSSSTSASPSCTGPNTLLSTDKLDSGRGNRFWTRGGDPYSWHLCHSSWLINGVLSVSKFNFSKCTMNNVFTWFLMVGFAPPNSRRIWTTAALFAWQAT